MQKTKAQKLKKGKVGKIMKKQLKDKKGITLIALVITIIVLLILAGVAISMLSGDNGILNRATQAKEQTGTKGIVEQINLAITAAMMNSNAEIDSATLDQELKSYFGDNVTGNSTDGWIVTAGDKTYNVSPAGKAFPTAEIADLVNDTNCLGETTLVKDESTPKQTLYIPAGFRIVSNSEPAKASARKVDEGIVIEDKDKNQFVWVPVPDAIYSDTETLEDGTTKKTTKLPTSSTNLATAEYTYTPMAIETSAGNYGGILYSYSSSSAYLKYPNTTTNPNYQGKTSEFREPDILEDPTYGDKSTTADRGLNLINEYITGIKGTIGTDDATMLAKWKKQLQDEYNDMVKSVATYGGFYVGRYETSYDATKSKVAVVAGVPSATAANDNTKTWYELYQKQKDFANGNSYVTSTMIWGSQYDAMMNWMAKTGKTVGKASSNYNQSQTTGNSSYSNDVINKIYDLYGCNLEWTLEAIYTYGRATRGGRCNGSGYPADRYGYYPYDPSSFGGSRLTLYIR